MTFAKIGNIDVHSTLHTIRDPLDDVEKFERIMATLCDLIGNYEKKDPQVFWSEIVCATFITHKWLYINSLGGATHHQHETLSPCNAISSQSR